MAKTSTAAIALVSRDVKLSKDADETEVSFPVKFSAGHVVTENEAAQLQATYLRAFLGNVRSYVERGEKSYTSDEILSMWGEYELGAPREEGGETIRVEAALRVALRAKREGLFGMAADPQAVLPRGKGRKGKDGYVSAEDAKAARDAIAQKFLASERDEVKAAIASAEADIRAERKAAADAKAPASAVATASDFDV